MTTVKKLAAFVLCCSFLFVYADRSGAEECLKVESKPRQATIRVKGLKLSSSVAPATFCQLIPTSTYKLGIEKTGYETRWAKLTIDPSRGKASVSGNRMTHMLKSSLLPGYGQISNGNTGRGVTSFFAVAGLGIWAAISYADYYDRKDDAERSSTLAALARTLEVKKEFEMKYWWDSRAANASRDRALYSLALTAHAYLSNLVETCLLSMPPNKISSSDMSLTLGTPKKSMLRTVSRSVFFPGMGQKYLGHHFKGVTYQVLFLVTAITAVELNQNYDIATLRYEQAVRQLADASTDAERNIAALGVKRTWDDRRDKEKKRNAFYGACAAVYVLNIFDAVFTQSVHSKSTFKLTSSYGVSGARAGLTLRF
jgi:TM2 domain-containing membrane protein YozV